MKLKNKIYVTLFSVLIIIFSVLGIIIYQTEKTIIIDEVDNRMESHLDDFYTIFDDHINLKQSSVNIALNLANNIFVNSGGIVVEDERIDIPGTNQITKESKNYNVNKWTVAGVQLYNNFDLVDDIKSKSVETATIFQKIGDGYLRISTNVMKLDGKRAVGTYIPNSSKVIKTVESGKTFFGRAFVVNDWYLTAYQPIIIDGKTEGILYVGIKEKDYSFLKNVFSNKSYYETGFPFLVDKKGKFIIHPSNENDDISESKFFSSIKKEDMKINKYEGSWPEKNGETVFTYYRYFAPYESYISVSIFETSIDKRINDLLYIIILSVVVSLILFFFCLMFIMNPIISKIIDATHFAKTIASGDLTTTLEVTTEDEIATLSKTLITMQENLKNIIGDIRDGSETILSASTDIHSSSETISIGSEKQSQFVENVSSTMISFNDIIQKNRENTKATESIVEDAVSGVKRGTSSSEDTAESMKEIADSIHIIGDIAFKTNILALNASIEAARAGEQGKSFAIVASEVKKLAERSKYAAENVNELSTAGVQISEESGKLLSTLVPEIEKIAFHINEISNSSESMNDGASNVNSSVLHLEKISTENSNASKVMMERSKDLSCQADILTKSVSYFKL